VRRVVRGSGADFREVLGLEPGTTDMKTIQSRYRQLMRMLHPDKRTAEEEAMVGGKNVCDEAVAMVQKAMQAAKQDKDGGQAPAEESPDMFAGVMPRGGMSPGGSLGSKEGALKTPKYAPRRAEAPRRAHATSGPNSCGEAPGTPHSPAGVREEREERVLGNGARYRGQWRGDQQDGKGTLTWPDGSQYRGQFVGGVAHGAGRFTTSGGDAYEGQWLNDKASGTGHYRGSDGKTYSGQWEDDAQHGHGTEVFANGTRYEGDFRKGLKHGVGRFSWKDGSVYEGQFNNNDIHGTGTYVWANGRRYEGQWVKEKMHGHGKYTFPSGSTYVGEYRDDLKAGNGTFTWTDGHVYTGQWEGGKQDGQGSMTSPDGTTKAGVWQAGRRVGPTSEGGAQAAPRTSPGASYVVVVDLTSEGHTAHEPVPWTPTSPKKAEPTPQPKKSSPKAASRAKSVLLGFVAAASPLGIPTLLRARSASRKPRKGFDCVVQDPEELISI
jgi:hypothetical protein